ncbi:MULTISPECIES: DUF418 domain-containing protein [Bacillus cereus group]|uniref:DUF418 domain-containing protein n=1 Tax=Bacillus paranthracis TaxID=2026186 RepID=A0A9X8SA49_9BACI|nr:MULTISPECIES: DUF418 domain-containing protein [Bacillus cereus group]MDA1989047.1 DUF418 domain-containing protein [Bacillus cereus group sp. BcHK104]MDX6046344.1 DUF418 domain-containing protein [Bacillus paranthracis]ONG82107.1 hypothetical protein BKK41_08580 [Bacillus cereus]SMD85706.1 hypothetical protein BACERE00221_01133 [Bacillus paranthracis]
MNAIKQSLPQKNRIVDLDVIRGFALIGIFLVNIAEFSQRAGAGQLSGGNWIDILATGKFYAIFSLLFGAGSALFLSRAKAKGQPYSLYIRRMIILAVIGLLHASIWSGDVLVPYAIVGLVLLSLHKIPGKWLLGISLTFHVIGIIVSIMSYDYLYGGNLNVPPLLNVLQVITTLTGFLIYFIEGFSLMQMDIFTKLRKNPKLHTILLIVVGSISITGVTFQFLTEGAKLSFIILTILQPFLALTYILILMAMLKSKLGSVVLHPLQAYGKMAMSNYLGQTFVGIFILPLFVKSMDLAFLMINVCLLTWIVQIILSNVWLKYFNFGPIEWIWRCLTYWNLVPIRKNNRKNNI